MKILKCIIILPVLAALPVMAGTSLGVAPVLPEEASPWEVRIAAYGWAQAVEGDVGAKGLTTATDISFDDIIEDLEIAAMGAVEMSRGRWSFLADMVYAETSDRVPIVGYEQDHFLGNFFVMFEAAKSDILKFDRYAGARVNSLGLEISLGPLNRSADQTWVDPVMGGRFQNELGNSLFFRTVGDVGKFGMSSGLTCQAMAGVGYRVMDQGAILLGYRGLGTDYSSGGFFSIRSAMVRFLVLNKNSDQV
jgi:hypothetical protein